MKNDETIEILISKTKVILLAIACLAFVFASAWLWVIADEYVTFSAVQIRIISVLGVAFFGFAFALFPKKLFDKRPGLIIDNNGIQNNLGFSTSYFISWKNITGFDIYQIKQTKILLIFVNNADEIISRERKWKQRLMRYSQKSYGTPISIGSGTLKCSFEELEKLLRERHAAVIK